LKTSLFNFGCIGSSVSIRASSRFGCGAPGKGLSLLDTSLMGSSLSIRCM
jgi:hypothetical protein